MKGKIVWLGVSFLMAVALVLSSCAKQVAPGEEEGVIPREQEEEAATLIMGETYRSSNVVLTVSGAYISDRYDYIDPTSKTMTTIEASPGKLFLFASVYIKNVGSDIRNSEGFRRWVASDSKGNTYYYSTYYGEGRLGEVFALYPDKEMSGKVLFEIPEGAGGLRIAYVELKFAGASAAGLKLAEWVIQ